MNVAHLRGWDLTPIEIALDLEAPSFDDRSSFGFAGPAEPRIRLVTAFALTTHLKHIVAAVDRALPPCLPPSLRIAASQTRTALGSTIGPLSIRPMTPLVRAQSRLVRAIKPGLADPRAYPHDMGEAQSHYIREFIPSKALPALELSLVHLEFTSTRLTPAGITMYRLDRTAKPRSILAHWVCPHDARRSLHVQSWP